MNKQLLIDEDCPMCRHYGKFLAKRHKVNLTSYQKEKKEMNKYVDFNIAKNRIALINKEGENVQVSYGVDALLIAFKEVFPRMTSFFKKDVPLKIARILYSFISYNRKIIAPAPMRSDYLCLPDFNIGYRWAYIIFTALFTSLILNIYCESIFENVFGLGPSFYRELLVCFGQIIWQSLVFYKWDKEYKMEYLGNMMTVSFIGAILLIPYLLIDKIFDIQYIMDIIYFFIVVNIMLLEHMRRCKILGLGWSPSISWVAYRLFILFIFYLSIK
jgi:predicted DCC family thiol-disulfide oxidoreductase YuxK